MNRFPSIWFALMTLVVLGASAGAQDWNVQLVDDSGDVGYDSQIAVLSNGTPYIAFVGESSNLKLAWWVEQGEESGWNFDVLGNASAGRVKEMLVDSQDRLHLVWCYSSNSYYGIYSPVTQDWVLGPEVVPIAQYNAHLDLALWQSGSDLIPVVVGNADSNSPVKLATRNPGTGAWTAETCSGTYLAYGPSSVAVDASGGCHVSFCEQSGWNLVYAGKPTGGSWAYQTVDVTGNIGQYSSIIVDGSGAVYIAYYDYTNGDLKFATTVLP
jgi:hypothetical protein